MGAGAALEAARRPDAEQLPHEQPEIQAADLQEQALEDVAVSAQVHAAHPSGCVEMRIGTFEAFTAPTRHPLTACARNPSPVGIYRVTGDVLPAPVAPAPVGLRHVAADLHLGQLGLKAQVGEPLAAELDAAKRHIGELSMENELLRERARAAERRLPLAKRRSRR